MSQSTALAFIIILGLSLFTGSCTKSNKKSGLEKDTATVVAKKAATTDSTMYATLGEGTGMSVVELVTDKGDTLYLTKDNEETGQSALIIGDIEYGNRYAFTMNKEQESLVSLVNMTQLAHMWIQPIPGMEGQQGFSLKSDGSAESINMSTLQYQKWRIFNGKLVLYMRSIGNRESFNTSDTVGINLLSDDSLIINRAGNIDKYSVKAAKKSKK